MSNEKFEQCLHRANTGLKLRDTKYHHIEHVSDYYFKFRECIREKPIPYSSYCKGTYTSTFFEKLHGWKYFKNPHDPASNKIALELLDEYEKCETHVPKLEEECKQKCIKMNPMMKEYDLFNMDTYDMESYSRTMDQIKECSKNCWK